MPPRFAYWTILIDNQPTAFRAREADELLPTFNRLRDKHPGAVMMWFQEGRLWNSREEAQAAFVAARREAALKKRAAEEPPRDRKWRPGGAHRDPRQKYKDARKAKWTRFKERIRSGERPRPPGKVARPQTARSQTARPLAARPQTPRPQRARPQTPRRRKDEEE